MDDIVGALVNKVVNCNLQYINYRIPNPIHILDTAISGTDNSNLYLSADAPQSEKNPSAPPIIVGISTGYIHKYTATCRTLPTHLPNHLRKVHILPNFDNSLVGIGPFCYKYCKVLFNKDTIAVFDPDRETIFTRWQ